MARIPNGLKISSKDRTSYITFWSKKPFKLNLYKFLGAYTSVGIGRLDSEKEGFVKSLSKGSFALFPIFGSNDYPNDGYALADALVSLREGKKEITDFVITNIQWDSETNDKMSRVWISASGYRSRFEREK